MTANEFRAALLVRSPEEIVEEIILDGDPGPNLSNEAIDFFGRRIRARFHLSEQWLLKFFVVGSAKLGFAALEKPGRDGRASKPAYRQYVPGDSDIDIAVVSPVLYGRLWQELARVAANQSRFPWRSDLAAYMLSGWIRPDKFPPNAPNICMDWTALVNEVSISREFKYKKLRCGIYQSQHFLSLYQQRSVRMAREQELIQA